jgi:hypothetical protein
MGGPLFASKTGLKVWRKVAAPLEAPLIKATRGRLKLNPAVPMVVLTSLGARSGKRHEVPLAYFTDGNDVILIELRRHTSPRVVPQSAGPPGVRVVHRTARWSLCGPRS